MKTMLFGAAIVFLSAASATADVQLTMQNGRVTIVAKDASVRQILTEWARVGQTKIVNVERIPGGPMTLELRNVPESQALDVLLRTLSGYNTAPRGPEIAPQGTYPGMPRGGLPAQQQNPNQAPAPTPSPTSPFGGVAVPGMIVAPPPGQQQPGQIQQPQQPQPGQPVRRPGG